MVVLWAAMWMHRPRLCYDGISLVREACAKSDGIGFMWTRIKLPRCL